MTTLDHTVLHKLYLISL